MRKRKTAVPKPKSPRPKENRLAGPMSPKCCLEWWEPITWESMSHACQQRAPWMICTVEGPLKRCRIPSAGCADLLFTRAANNNAGSWRGNNAHTGCVLDQGIAEDYTQRDPTKTKFRSSRQADSFSGGVSGLEKGCLPCSNLSPRIAAHFQWAVLVLHGVCRRNPLSNWS